MESRHCGWSLGIVGQSLGIEGSEVLGLGVGVWARYRYRYTTRLG